MVDTIRSQAELLAFLHPNIPNPQPDSTVLVAQAARDLIVSIPSLFGPSGGRLELGTGTVPTVRPNWFGVYDGTFGTPVVTPNPTAEISRVELIPSSPNVLDPQYNAGLYVALGSLTGNQVQPTAVAGLARGYSTHTALGGNLLTGGHFVGWASDPATTSGALGVFALAQIDPGVTLADAAVGVNPTVELLNGIDYPWGLGLPVAAVYGVDTDIETGGAAHYGTAAYLARAGGAAKWDIGYAVAPGNLIRTAGFEDDSNSPTVFKVRGSHTDGFDPSGGSFTGSPFVFPAAQTFSPTLSSSGGGTPGSATATGRWLAFGKFIWVEVTITITTAAPATNFIEVFLPGSHTSQAAQVLAGRESSVGLSLVANAAAGASAFLLSLSNNGVTAVNGYVMSFSGFLEIS